MIKVKSWHNGRGFQQGSYAGTLLEPPSSAGTPARTPAGTPFKR